MAHTRVSDLCKSAAHCSFPGRLLPLGCLHCRAATVPKHLPCAACKLRHLQSTQAAQNANCYVMHVLQGARVCL